MLDVIWGCIILLARPTHSGTISSRSVSRGVYTILEELHLNACRCDPALKWPWHKDGKQSLLKIYFLVCDVPLRGRRLWVATTSDAERDVDDRSVGPKPRGVGPLFAADAPYGQFRDGMNSNHSVGGLVRYNCHRGGAIASFAATWKFVTGRWVSLNPGDESSNRHLLPDSLHLRRRVPLLHLRSRQMNVNPAIHEAGFHHCR